MKLCRFDLASSPGTPRSGIVHGGKVYETDGTNPVDVHDWTDAHLLAPVGQPSSFRLFTSLPATQDREAFDFRYLNPGVLVGPHGTIAKTEATELACLPCLAVVVAGSGANVPVAEADGLVLGITLVNVFYQPSEVGPEGLPAWAFDAGSAVGPALTTPDELDDSVIDETNGRKYEMDISLSLNGDEVFRTNVAKMGATLAELLSYASLTCRIRQGDLLAVALTDAPAERLKSGDQVRLVSNKLGTLVTNLI